MERLQGTQEQRGGRAAALRRDIAEVETQIVNLGVAVKSGKATDVLLEMLEAEHGRKKALMAEMDALAHGRAASLDTRRLHRELSARVTDVRGLLGRHVPRARQILRKLVVGRLACEAINENGVKGYGFTGQGSYDRVLPGETLAALTHTPNVVTPAGTARFRLTLPLRMSYKLAT